MVDVNSRLSNLQPFSPTASPRHATQSNHSGNIDQSHWLYPVTWRKGSEWLVGSCEICSNLSNVWHTTEAWHTGMIEWIKYWLVDRLKIWFQHQVYNSQLEPKSHDQVEMIAVVTCTIFAMTLSPLFQGKGGSFASVSPPYLSWASASSLCLRRTRTPSRWTRPATATALQPRTTTSFRPPARAAALLTPTTHGPSSAPATAPPPCRGLWTTRHLRAHGAGCALSSRWGGRLTGARRTPWWRLHQYRASLQPLPERLCAAFAGPPRCTTWRALAPTQKWPSGTGMPAKVGMTC